MRCILQIYKSFSGKLTAFMVFSFFVSGCHAGEEPVSVTQVTVKKEAANPCQAKEIQTETLVKTRKKIPETPVNNSASGIFLPQKQENQSRIYDSSPDGKNPDAASRRDPFAPPPALRKQRSVTQGKQVFTSEKCLPGEPLQQTAAHPGPPEPCVAGIFDNGKEKLALIRWQQVQGTFHRGEPLGNGYYVKEITDSAVSLYPEKNVSGIKPVTLTLPQ